MKPTTDQTKATLYFDSGFCRFDKPDDGRELKIEIIETGQAYLVFGLSTKRSENTVERKGQLGIMYGRRFDPDRIVTFRKEFRVIQEGDVIENEDTPIKKSQVRVTRTPTSTVLSFK